jgi:dihydrofolate reductase
MADRLNAATKYVVTHRPESLEWGPVEGLGPNLVEDVRRIKDQDGPDLIVTGSSTLTSTLLEEELAEDVVLAVSVLLGTGKRLMAQGSPAALLGAHQHGNDAVGHHLSHYRVAR